jgi:hypothetical protein
MKPFRSTLARFAVSALIVGILTQTTFAAFRFGVSSGDFFSIDYEGSGTITHMNANQPSRFKNPPTSLLDLNIMRASDLRVEIFGSLSGTLEIGQPTPGPGFGVTLVSYFINSFSPTSFVPVGQTPGLFALNPTAATTLQSLIDIHGANKLFLSLSMRAGIFGFGGVGVFSAVREIDIDLKPGNDSNPINPRAKGKITVAILTTADFDANTVDVDSVRFGATGSEALAEHSAFDDVDGDGDLDLVLHFRTHQANLGCGTEVALLRGTSLTGELIGRWDTVITVGCR